MSEQNTGWRDISTAPLDGTVVLVRDDCGCVYSANFCPLEQSWKLADQDGWRWCDDLEQVIHWQPLPPPPGEDVESELDIYKLSFDEVVRHKDDQIKALQARYDKLEAAANALFAKWAREDRSQVIRELIEKAEDDGRKERQNNEPISTCLDRRQRAQGAADWLKSQMEGE